MLDRIFQPKSVAVVGATADTEKLRGKIVPILQKCGFKGPIYPVNPRHGEIFGLRTYSAISALPEVPDLVLIATPGEGVPDIVAEAAKAGAGGAVVFSSGVDEVALAHAVEGAGLRVFGPNTEGFFQPDGGVGATFAPVVEHVLDAPRPGQRPGRKISIVSQSGGLGFAFYGRGLKENLDFHSVITTGNEFDIDVLEVVDHLLDDGRTGVVVLFIEGLKHPRRFMRTAARAAEKGVPLIVMKVGGSEAGQRAALSHTAHLAGADTAYDAVFRKWGAIRVNDQEEMMAAAAALSRLPPMAGRRVGIVTTSGGAGVWAADLCAARGLDVPAFGETLSNGLAEIVPSFGSAANPIDLTASATENGAVMLLDVLKLLDESPEIDGVLVNVGLSKTGRIRGLATTLGPLLAGAGKPVAFHSHIDPSTDNLEAIAELGGCTFMSFRGAAFGLHALAEYAQFQARPAKERAGKPPGGPGRLAGAAPGVLDETGARDLLESYGIPVPPSRLIRQGDDLHKRAAEVGFPLALKIQSPDIPHKTEVGGVILNVDAAGLEAAYQRVVANAVRAEPHARIEGVLAQKMAAPGFEMVVGVVHDRDFGPMVMIGAGGIYLEVLNDVVFVPPPVSPDEALRLIRGLKVAPILAGARGKRPLDVRALADLVVRVSEMAAREEGALDQLDFNPVFVYPEAEGVVAVDVLVGVGGARSPQRHVHG